MSHKRGLVLTVELNLEQFCLEMSVNENFRA